MALDCFHRFKLNLRLHLISLPRLICASVRSGPIVIHGPDRSVGLRCFWIGLGSVRSKFILELVRSDSISKIVGPAHWTEPNRDRTDVVHPWFSLSNFSSGLAARASLAISTSSTMHFRRILHWFTLFVEHIQLIID